MSRFRNKGRDVTAVQWFKPGDHPKVTAMPDGMPYPEGAVTMLNDQVCGFLGHALVKPGDWIVDDIQDQAYVCSDADFGDRYAAVEG